jgi:hypothetical protein
MSGEVSGSTGRPINLPVPTDVEGSQQLAKTDALEGMWKATISDIKAVDAGTMTRTQLSEALHVRQLQLQQLQSDQPALEAAQEVKTVSQTDLQGFESQLARAQLVLGAAIATNSRVLAQTPSSPTPGEGGNPCFGASSAGFYIALMQCAENQKQNQLIMGPIMVEMRGLQVSIRDTRMQVAKDLGEAEKSKALIQGVASIVAGTVGFAMTIGGAAGGGPGHRMEGMDVGGKMGGTLGQITTGIGSVIASDKEIKIANLKAEEIALQDAGGSIQKQMDDAIKSFGASQDEVNKIKEQITSTSQSQHNIRWGAQ